MRILFARGLIHNPASTFVLDRYIYIYVNTIPVINLLPLSSNSPFNICSIIMDRILLSISSESTTLNFLSSGRWRNILGKNRIPVFPATAH